MKTGSENIYVITEDSTEICENTLAKVSVSIPYCCGDGGNITPLPPSNASSHNALNGLQGGNVNERYHLSRAEYDSVRVIPSLQFITRIGNKTVDSLVVWEEDPLNPSDPNDYGTNYGSIYSGGAFFSKKNSHSTVGNNYIALNTYSNGGSIEYGSTFQNNVGGFKYFINQTNGILEMKVGVGYDVTNSGRYFKFDSDINQSNKFYDEYLSKGLSYGGNYDLKGKLDDNWIPSWGAVKSVASTKFINHNLNANYTVVDVSMDIWINVTANTTQARTIVLPNPILPVNAGKQITILLSNVWSGSNNSWSVSSSGTIVDELGQTASQGLRGSFPTATGNIVDDGAKIFIFKCDGARWFLINKRFFVQA